jgi:hypothetical protein
VSDGRIGFPTYHLLSTPPSVHLAMHFPNSATESGYEHTQTKLLDRAVARQFHLAEVHVDEGNKQIWRRGGFKPQVSRKLRFTREVAAIAFISASFQNSRVKRRKVPRSVKKPKEWRKTVTPNSSKGKSTVLDSSECPRSRRFYPIACPSNSPTVLGPE